MSDCTHCKIRNASSGGTFKQNCYTFGELPIKFIQFRINSYISFCLSITAAHVQMISETPSDEKRHVDFSVIKQFNLLTSSSNDQGTAAPSMNENITVFIDSPHICSGCAPLKTGVEYLIAGIYIDTSTDIIWEINNKNDEGLVSQWTDKYTKRMDKWIAAANEERSCTL